MRLFICGSYAIASDHAVFPAATNNFSDSIILFIKSSDEIVEQFKQLYSICWITNAFIVESLIKDDQNRVFQLPLRGAIAYGPAFMDTEKRIHIGQPIIDAYNLSENMNWVGGAIHTSVDIPNDFIEELIGFNKQIFEYDSIPFKSVYTLKNEINLALNWVQQHPAGVKWFPEMEGRDSRPLLRDISYHIDSHSWGQATDKKENTEIFAERICREYDERGI